MSYRKKYLKAFYEASGENIEVHHIDFDRTNNDISNLVAISATLHRNIHRAQRFFEDLVDVRGTDFANVSRFPVSDLNELYRHLEAIIELCEIRDYQHDLIERRKVQEATDE